MIPANESKNAREWWAGRPADTWIACIGGDAGPAAERDVFISYASQKTAVATAVNSLNPKWEQPPCSID